MTQEEGKRSEFIVAEGEQGLRMDVFLPQKDPTLSRSQAKRLIEDGDAIVDGKPVRASHRLKTRGKGLPSQAAPRSFRDRPRGDPPQHSL